MALFSFFNRSEIEQSQAQKEVTANAMLGALARSAGILSKATVAGTNTLTEEESEYGVILLTGALGATATVVQDADVTKPTFYQNLTTGGQTVNVKLGSGTSFSVPTNGVVLLLSTTDAIRLHSATTALVLGTSASAGTSEELSRVDHVHPRDVINIPMNMDLIALTNMPLALTELNGQTHRRTKYDLTNFTQARLVTRVETSGLAGSEIRAQYSTDESSWAYLDNSAGPASVLDATGVKTSGYVTLIAGAKADVFLRTITINGDGAADPVMGECILQVK